jgi:ParB-like chromosome segregation protein Spo0J
MTEQEAQRLIQLPLAEIDEHPLNANVMSDEQRTKLADHIRKTGRYLPLIVRPFQGRYQTLDGAQRKAVLESMGVAEAWCLVWEVSDHDALLLLAALNRLRGEDVPARRAALLAALSEHDPLAELARLLPEDEAELSATIALSRFELDAFVAELEQQARRQRAALPRVYSFAVDPADAALVDRALAAALEGLSGRNRQARALVRLAAHYLEAVGGEAS